MAIAVTALGSNNSGSGVANVACSAANVPAGSLIVAFVYEGGGTVTSGSIQDLAGNTYTQALTTGGQDCVYYCGNCLAMAGSGYIQYNKSNSANGAIISAFYATGIQKIANPRDTAVDAYNSQTQTANPTVTSGTPTVPGELIVCSASWQNGGTNGFTQATGAWGNLPADVAGVGIELAGGWQVNAGKTALTWTPTVAAMTAPYYAHAIGFKPPPVAVGFNMPMMGI